MEQVVHEQAGWTLLEACLEDSEDCDHLPDLNRMDLNDGRQQMLQHHTRTGLQNRPTRLLQKR